MAARPVLAIDIGGTKTLAALVDGPVVLDQRRAETPRGADAEGWIDAIAGLVGDWAGRYDRAGIAVTGGISDGRWYALNPDTLPVPAGFPLVERLSARLGVPVAASNDAQAAAWGEYRHGAGQGADLVFLTISTGIGGGIVLGGKLLTGRSGVAGHIGVSYVETPDGERLLEEVGSGSALARLARASGRNIDPPAVFAAAEAGDASALGLVDRVIEPVARAIRSLQLILDPDLFVVGGGMGLAPLYLKRMGEVLATVRPEFRPTLRAAALGANAGIIGVADLVLSTSSAP